MPTPAELAQSHTDLKPEELEHLQRLLGSWGVLADLSFSDLLLLVPVHASTVGGNGQGPGPADPDPDPDPSPDPAPAPAPTATAPTPSWSCSARCGPTTGPPSSTRTWWARR